MKDKIADIENQRDWEAAIALIEGVEEPICDLYLRVMFLLLDFVVEGEHTLEEHEYAAKKLRELFIKCQSKFANDAEFSFFPEL